MKKNWSFLFLSVGLMAQADARVHHVEEGRLPHTSIQRQTEDGHEGFTASVVVYKMLLEDKEADPSYVITTLKSRLPDFKKHVEEGYEGAVMLYANARIMMATAMQNCIAKLSPFEKGKVSPKECLENYKNAAFLMGDVFKDITEHQQSGHHLSIEYTDGLKMKIRRSYENYLEICTRLYQETQKSMGRPAAGLTKESIVREAFSAIDGLEMYAPDETEKDTSLRLGWIAHAHNLGLEIQALTQLRKLSQRNEKWTSAYKANFERMHALRGNKISLESLLSSSITIQKAPNE